MTNTRIGHMLAATREQAAPERLRPLPDRLVGWRPLPPLLLLAALSTVFIFANDRGAFYRPGHHSEATMHTLSLATNLSPDHNFLLYNHVRETETGYHDVYSRFPIGTYALVKLAILPFRSDISNQIHSARIIMLLFFIGSSILAYFSLEKIFQNKWSCLSGTALAFSSYYILYYYDIVSPEHTTNLFGIFLTFHGMVTFIRDGRFRQLLVKTCIALFFGWHVYALLIPFIIFGIISSFASWRRRESREWKGTIILSIRNRFLILGIVSIFFGGVLLSFNIVNEYIAFDGEKSLRELPTIDSLAYRSGFNSEFNDQHSDVLRLQSFTREQMYRLGSMMLPYGIPGFSNMLRTASGDEMGTHGVVLGVFACSLVLIILTCTRHKIYLIPLASMGFIWSFPFRNQTAFHEVESIFYIGIPLIINTFFFLHFREKFGVRYMSIISLIPLLILCFSIAQIGRIGLLPVEEGRQEVLFNDIEDIRELTKGKVLFIPANLRESGDINNFAIGFYFPGIIISVSEDSADYAISRENLLGKVSLVSNTTSLFLYTAEEYSLGYDDAVARIETTVLLLSARNSDIDGDATGYDVYHDDNSLWYLQREECDAGPAERGATFFLHVVPLNADDLPANRREFGFDGLDFLPAEHWLDAGGYCVIERRLPQYDIASIRTGQYDASGELWSGEIRIAEPE